MLRIQGYDGLKSEDGDWGGGEVYSGFTLNAL